MKIKIEIKRYLTGDLLFEFEKENNIIKDTVQEAVKRGTNLRGANLCDAILHYADLCGADLRSAVIHGADLHGTNLRGADLRGADLCGANLLGADNVPFIPYSCPSDGAFIGWKKISTYKENYKGNYLVQLMIPEDARRCSANTITCRCDKAMVVSITSIESGEKIDVITNIKRRECVYEVGKMVYPDSFDDDRWNVCSHGIYFFINKQSAIDY